LFAFMFTFESYPATPEAVPGAAGVVHVTPNVPDVVIGEPETEKFVGTVIATEVTVPNER
jgi:hypothetical protein